MVPSKINIAVGGSVPYTSSSCVYTQHLHNFYTIKNEVMIVIKIYVRAIVPTVNAYVLMGEPDKSGEIMWDLPGGALEAGQDVKQLLQKLVLKNTGYTITDLKFFEIACKVQPRTRAQDPVTTLDFIFTSTIDSAVTQQEPAKDIELLPFDHFEWLDSGKRFNLNKVMNLLSRYHSKTAATHDKRLNVDVEPNVV